MNELSFEVSGEGEPVVLLPGFPFGEHTFRQLAPLLATVTPMAAPTPNGARYIT